MMPVLSKSLAVGLVAVLGACVERPVTSGPTNNPRLSVDLLFEHDGCRIYRFFDAGYYRYFARCHAGSSISDTRPITCGKSCTRITADVIWTESDQ